MPISPALSRAPRLRAHFLPIGLQTQFYLWGLLLLGLTTLAFALGTWAIIEAQSFRQAEDQIGQGLLALEHEQQNDKRDLDALGKLLVNDGGFVQLVRVRDRQSLSRQLEPLVKTNLIDAAIVSDGEGKLLGQATANGITISVSEFAALAAPKSPAAQETLFFDKNGSRHLFQRTILPIYDGWDTPPIGSLALGHVIDSAYLHRAANLQEIEYAFVSGNRVILTTLTNPNGQRLQGSLAPVPVADPLSQLFSKNLTIVATDHGQYLFKFSSTRDPDAANFEAVGAGIPISILDQERRLLTSATLMFVAVGAAGLVVGGFIFRKRLVKPLQHLTTTANAMARGNLTSQVRLDQAGGIPDLAQAVEQVRARQLETSAELERQSSWYGAMIGAMSAPLVITNAKHKIVTVNSAALALLRANGDNIVGQPWHNFFAIGDSPDGPVSFWHPNSRSGDGDDEMVVRGRFPLRTQPDVVLDIISTQVTWDNSHEGYVHVLTDVSELERFSRTKDEFLLNVAHELRGPLSSWHLSLQVLIEDYPNLSPRELGGMLRGLERRTIKFEQFVEVLIDIGKMQAGRFKIRPAPVRIHILVKDGIEAIEPTLKAKGQAVELHPDCPAACMVLADRARILQVIINLLNNASKYGPEDQEIKVWLYRQGGFVFVEVADQGEGIPPEDQAQLFERFFRGKRAEQEGGGIGIGLALCKGIIDAHGGQMGFRSQMGQGATFWFSLPEINESPDRQP